MKVRILLNLGFNDYGENALPAGEHEVAESLGRMLVKRGHAVEVVQDPQQVEVAVKAVAEAGQPVADRTPVTVSAAKPRTRSKNKSNPVDRATN